jgi:glycine cleavage system transcriptional repressor
VSVYGADHPGILSAVAGTLAETGANVVDLSSRVVGEPPIYVVGIEAELPEDVTEARLRAILAPVGESQHVEVSVSVTDDEVM